MKRELQQQHQAAGAVLFLSLSLSLSLPLTGALVLPDSPGSRGWGVALSPPLVGPEMTSIGNLSPGSGVGGGRIPGSDAGALARARARGRSRGCGLSGGGGRRGLGGSRGSLGGGGRRGGLSGGRGRDRRRLRGCGAVRAAVDGVQDCDQLCIVIVRHVPEHHTADSLSLDIVDLDSQGLNIIIRDKHVGGSIEQPRRRRLIVPVAGPTRSRGCRSTREGATTQLLPLPQARVHGTFVAVEVDVVGVGGASLGGGGGVGHIHGHGVLGVHIHGCRQGATIEGGTDHHLVHGPAGTLPGCDGLDERVWVTGGSGGVEGSVGASGVAPGAHDVVGHDR